MQLLKWRKITKWLTLISLLILLVGCHKQQTSTDSIVILDTKMYSNKKHIVVNEPFIATAEIKAKKDIHKDTTVEFEIIENGVSAGTAEPTYKGNGKYSLKLMFSSKGEQIITAHIHYKDHYEMPFLTLNVSE